MGGNHFGGCRRLLGATRQNKEVDRGTGQIPEQYRNTIAGRPHVSNKGWFERRKGWEFGVEIIRIQKIPGGRCGVNQIVADKEPGFAKGYDGTNEKRLTNYGRTSGIVLYILPGDTVTTVLRCIEYSDKWVDLDGCIINNTFSGKIITRDSLLITESVQYKRWLGFLWKTNG